LMFELQHFADGVDFLVEWDTERRDGCLDGVVHDRAEMAQDATQLAISLQVPLMTARGLRDRPQTATPAPAIASCAAAPCCRSWSYRPRCERRRLGALAPEFTSTSSRICQGVRSQTRGHARVSAETGDRGRPGARGARARPQGSRGLSGRELAGQAGGTGARDNRYR
jgi:hypothetical protein